MSDTPHMMSTMSQMTDDRIPRLTLGWRLKMALDEMSAQEMADNLGVSRATISRWMGDKGAPPKTAYVKQWALATGVPLAWLQTGKTPGPIGPGEGVRHEEFESPTRWFRIEAGQALAALPRVA